MVKYADLAGWTYALRERSEVYAGEYGGDNDVLTSGNTVAGKKTPKGGHVARSDQGTCPAVLINS